MTRSGTITYFRKSPLLCVAGTVMGEVVAITYFTKPALLWLAGSVMGEVRGLNIFHGAIINVVAWYGYGRGRV